MDSETHIFGTSPPLKTFEPHMSLSSMGDSRAGLPVSFLFSSLGSNPLCTRNFCPGPRPDDGTNDYVLCDPYDHKPTKTAFSYNFNKCFSFLVYYYNSC